MWFCYFVIISPWKKTWPFIWTSLNSHHLRMLCAKFGWNWLSSSWEEDENVDRRTDGRQAIRKVNWASSSRELKSEEKQVWALSILRRLCPLSRRDLYRTGPAVKRASVAVVSPESLPHSVASYHKQGLGDLFLSGSLWPFLTKCMNYSTLNNTLICT